MPPKNKIRLDTLLLDKEYFKTREQARSAIMQGAILINNEKITKPGTFINPGSEITVLFTSNPYVGRGGIKLEYALRYFEINAMNKICLDVGASTGGFTDCLLKRGAEKVYAIDVGYGQFDWELRKNPKVVLFERTNVRYAEVEKIYKKGEKMASLCAIDLSFISLSKVFSPILRLVEESPEAHILTLFKPQFEALRHEVGKRGVIRDKNIHKALLMGFAENVSNIGLNVRGVTYSPITGSAGNIEFWFDITFNEKDSYLVNEEVIDLVIYEAHKKLGKSERKKSK